MSDMLLKPFYAEINGDLDKLSGRIAALGQRPDLSSLERTDMQRLLAKWTLSGKGHDRRRSNRRAMATMMLGQTDDTFEAVDTEVQGLSRAISWTANILSTALYSDAEWNLIIII